MKILRNISIILLSVISILTINFGYCSIYDGEGGGRTFEGNSTPQFSGTIVEEIDSGSKSFSDKLQGILNRSIPQKEKYDTSLGYALALITIAVNWILGILAFVAMVYMLYCGFLVLSAGSDDKNVSKGKKGISTASIALAGIGLSWLIISAMIWFIKLITTS